MKAFIIEDDLMMSECVERALEQALPTLDNHVEQEHKILKITNAIEAMSLLNEDLPDLIFLDVLLNGPDGFSFLNELISYNDTAKIPVVIMTSLNLEKYDLGHYNIKHIFQKETMTPQQIVEVALEILQDAA